MSAKKRKRVVVDEAYFNLIENKAALLDRVFEEPPSLDLIKEQARLYKAWFKLPDVGGVVPYEEPKAP